MYGLQACLIVQVIGDHSVDGESYDLVGEGGGEGVAHEPTRPGEQVFVVGVSGSGRAEQGLLGQHVAVLLNRHCEGLGVEVVDICHFDTPGGDP